MVRPNPDIVETRRLYYNRLEVLQNVQLFIAIILGSGFRSHFINVAKHCNFTESTIVEIQTECLKQFILYSV